MSKMHIATALMGIAAAATLVGCTVKGSQDKTNVMSRENVEQGRCAYRAFLSGLRRGERLRFAVTRIFKGLGDFESIP